MTNNSHQKSLSEVFKELQTIKENQIHNFSEEKTKKEEASFMFHLKTRTKLDNIKLILIVLLILFVFSMFSTNYIFAKDLETLEAKKVSVASFEKNENPQDVYKIISENISNVYQKEIIDRDEQIQFETEYINNKDLPEGEQQVLQEGTLGSKKVTYVINYENDNVTSEFKIGESITEEPQKEIIQVGTSSILKQCGIHIGDNLYVSQDIDLRKESVEESESLKIVPAFYDVKALEIIDEAWFKVEYEGEIGFISCNFLTSETLTPQIGEICRKAKILNKVDFNMNLNEPSGLLLSDYEKIFLNFSQDTNNVFKENYNAFFEAEQKYGINGVFLASIAIHESNWGKSAIAVNKHNLFGFGAYDASPYESAVTFETYSEGIDTVAKWLSSKYLNSSGVVLKNGDIASGAYFNGTTISNVNTRYASDTEWGAKLFKTMQNIYSELN